MFLRLVLLASIATCAIGGYPSATTIFRDVHAPDALLKSYNLFTEIWRFQREYVFAGLIIGSRVTDIDPPTTPTATYQERISVALVKHNGTYGAPRTLVATGVVDGEQEYGSSLFIPLVRVDGKEAPTVLPVDDGEHTLYYVEIDFQAPAPGFYPYFYTREVDYFGAVSDQGSSLGMVAGIEYSKPEST